MDCEVVHAENEHIRYSRIPKSLWLILAVAGGLRLLGAWSGNLMYDESTHLALAETIDFRPDHFHIVFRSVDHPLLSVYVVRLSGYLFGNNNFGLRILHVLFGTATVVPVFLLGKRVFSEKAGLWAAALLAVDQFHQTWSYFIVPEVLLLFFALLVLLQFLHTTETKTLRGFVLLGLLLGLCYLAKETAFLLIPILWLCVLTEPGQRELIWNPRWYLAHVVVLLVVSPDILWNLTHFYEGYFFRDITLVSSGFDLSPRSGLLYLGEITSLLTGPRGGFLVNYATQNPSLVHWPVGLLYLFATLGAIRLWRRWPVRVLLLTFFGYFLFFTVLPAPFGRYNWWWASISLLPATIFAGDALERFAKLSWRHFAGFRWDLLPRVSALLLMCYLCIHAVSTALRPGVGVPLHSAAQLVERTLEKAGRASSPEEIRRSEWYLLHTLHITGPDAGIYGYLARVAFDRQQLQRAEYFVSRSLELDKENEVAREVSELMGQSRHSKMWKRQLLAE